MALPDESDSETRAPAPPSTLEGRVTDEAIESFLGRLLQGGVLVAAGLTLAGGVLYLAKYGSTHPHYARFLAEPDDLSHAAGIVRAALAGRGRGLIQLGCLVLIATPVMRVAVSLLAFVLQRDRLYILLTAVVLVVLLTSLTGVSL
jgi:uncharacterized membrane protein